MRENYSVGGAPPDTEQFKRFFIKEGVDLVGADDLNGLYNVLNER